MTASQKFRLALITLVCSGVFYISFSHITSIAQQYGNAAHVAWVYPLCIDGVILISALSLTARVGINKATKFYAKLGRWFGFAATIYANVLHSGYSSTDAIVVNVLPAIALIITVELLIHASAGTSAYRRRSNQKATSPAKLRSVA